MASNLEKVAIKYGLSGKVEKRSDSEVKAIDSEFRANVRDNESKRLRVREKESQSIRASTIRKKEAEKSKKRHKEDRLEPKGASFTDAQREEVTARGRSIIAKKRYDDYVQSDEYKKKRSQDIQKALEDHYGGVDTSQTTGAKSRTTVIDPKEKQLREQKEYWQARSNVAQDRNVARSQAAQVDSWPDEDKLALQDVLQAPAVETSSGVRYDFVKQRESRKVLDEKYGAENVGYILESVRRNQNEQDTLDAIERGKRDANESWLSASVAAVGNNFAGAVSAPFALAGEVIPRIGEVLGLKQSQFHTLDPNGAGNLGNAYSGAVQGQVLENIDENYDGIAQDLLSFAYQGGMSVADIGVNALASLGNPAAVATIHASSSATSTIAEASARGATPGRALELGAVTALVEWATEKIPMDSLVKIAKGGAGAFAKNLLKQGFSEGVTEEASLILSTIADEVIMREKSESKTQIGDMVANGMSYEDAKNQVLAQYWSEAVNTFLVSAVAGAVTGGVTDLAGKFVDKNAESQEAEYSENARRYFDQEQDAQPIQEAPQQTTQPVQEDVVQSDVPQKTQAQIFADAFAEDFLNRDTSISEETRFPPGTLKAAADEVFGVKRPEAEAPVPTEPITKAMEMDNVTNSAAERILEDPQSVSVLQEQSGVEITGTMSQRRAAVKEAVSKIKGERASTQQPLPDLVSGSDRAGTPEVNFAGTHEYDQLLSDENAQRDRPGDVRPVEVPKKDANGRRVSETVGNIYGSSMTPDSFIPTIREMVMEGSVSHDIQHNEETLSAAAKSIAETGVARSTREVIANASQKNASPETIAKAELLYNYFVNQTDPQSQQNAADIFVSLSELATTAGRSLQLYKMFRKMTPEGKADILQQTVVREVDYLKKAGKVKSDYVVEIDPRALDAYQRAEAEVQKLEQDMKVLEEGSKKEKTAQELEAARDAAKEIEETIFQNEAAKVGVTFKAKWDAWRYTSMLANVKTQVRNIGGNVLMMPYTGVKRKTNALAQRFLLPKEKRTSSVFSDSGLEKWAAEDAKSGVVYQKLSTNAKTGDSGKNRIEENMKIFDGMLAPLETVRKGTNAVMEWGDMIFKNHEYTRSLAGFLKARGYTEADVRAGKVSDVVLNEGRDFAIQEALKATFNDSNAFSDAVSNMRFKIDPNKPNRVKQVINIVGEGVLPFRKTPANVVVRFTEYSPVGLAKGLWDSAVNIRNGKVSAAAAIDELAAGLTGTMAMHLGAAMASGLFGFVLRGSNIDDDEKRQGYQEYAVEFTIGGQEYSYKVDWASPANLPLFVGANFYELARAENPDLTLSDITSFLQSGVTMFEPLLALSCLSSLNELFETAQYAEQNEKLFSIGASIATSYFTQGIPAFVRQVYQASTENRQQTFANDDDKVVRNAQKTIGDIPFVGDKVGLKTDYIDPWGQTQSNGNVAERVFNAFVNPGTGKKISNTQLDQEITRLNEVLEENVSPPYVDKSITYTDSEGNKVERRMTEAEYETMRTIQGQTAADILNSAVSQKEYQNLSDKQKGDFFKLTYEYASEKAQQEAFPDRYKNPPAWMDGMERNSVNSLVTKVLKDSLASAMDDVVQNTKRGFDSSNSSENLQEFYNSYSKSNSRVKAAVKEDLSGTASYYVDAREDGVSHDDFVRAAKKVANAKGTGSISKDTGKPSVRDIDKRGAIASLEGVPDRVIDSIMKAYMPDYDSAAGKKETTELKYDAVRDLGFDPEGYVDVYRAYLDNGRKNEKIRAIMAAGNCDYRTAKKVYDLFVGNEKPWE